MKILFVTDLHGRKWKYDRLYKVAVDFGADVVINGGDMLPKDGDLFDEQREFVTNYLDCHFAKFDAAGIYYLCYLGNDDVKILDNLFDKMCRKHFFIVCLAQRIFEINGFEFIGMNWVVDYPFRLKDRCRIDTKDYVFQEQFGTGLLSAPDGWKEIRDWFSYAKTLPTIEDELRCLPCPQDMIRSVYVIHMPPYKLGLDECGYGPKVGSRAVYDFLQKYQPRLSLHGHIHESPGVSGKWYAKLERTICIQPGQLDPFTYVTIDLDTLEFERHIETNR